MLVVTYIFREQCTEDKLIVYDGDSIKAPIIGIFCGHQTIGEIISQGSSLFLEFHTFAGSPPWDYTGFDARVGHRFPSKWLIRLLIVIVCWFQMHNNFVPRSFVERYFSTIFSGDFRTGQPITGKTCSWEFNSTLERFGTIHTPDYRILEDSIECEYMFYGQEGEYVEFEISITSLK